MVWFSRLVCFGWVCVGLSVLSVLECFLSVFEWFVLSVL